MGIIVDSGTVGITAPCVIRSTTYMPSDSGQTRVYSLPKHSRNVCKEINQLRINVIFTLNSSQVRKKSTKSRQKQYPEGSSPKIFI